MTTTDTTVAPAPGVYTGIEDYGGMDHVDLAARYAAGCRAVFLKATEGRTFTDHAFAARLATLAGLPGMLRGAYHFLRPGDVPAQATHFLGTVRAACAVAGIDFASVRLMVDDEPEGTQATTEDARAFVAAVHAATGRWPLYYCGQSKGRARWSDPADPIGQCDLFMARYSSGDPWTWAVPAPWTHATLIQYSDGSEEYRPTDHATYPVSHCDRSCWRGDLASLTAWWLGTPAA